MRLVVLACVACAVAAAGVAGANDTGTVAGTVLVNPLSVEVFVPPDPVRAGRSFRIRAEVVNAGAAPLRNVAVTLLANPTLVVYDPMTQLLARVGPGRDGRARWNACSTAPGGYVVMARAETGQFTTESTGQLVQVSDARRPTC